jgi:predicted amino acid dehydrogenase
MGSTDGSGYRPALRTAEFLPERTFKHLLAGKEAVGGIEKQLNQWWMYERIKRDRQLLRNKNLWKQFRAETRESCAIKVVTGIDELYDCNVVVVATNSSEPFLKPEHFQTGTIVYDISVPLNCTPELIANDKDIKVILGGITALPNKEKIEVKGLPIDDGYVYGCIGETMLLGLEGRRGNYSLGAIVPEQVTEIGEIGKKHGFSFVKPKINQVF